VIATGVQDNLLSLRQKTLAGLAWSFIDSFANQAILFVIGIVLARLLTPKEFGLTGMIVIFTAVSQSFIDCGFSQALIRKTNCSQEDYSTVFYFNFVVGILCYLVLFFLAGPISSFFHEPRLSALVRVSGINLVINSVGLIQRTILTKNVDFKLQTKISVISSIGSGVVGISMAYLGFGVWSLVWKTVSQNLVTTALFWLWNKWRPIMAFSARSFREMFGFGSKLVVSGLIDTVYRNVYYLIIGKFFSAADLGFYTRANDFRNIPSTNLTNIIGRVCYPVLAHMQRDDRQLKSGYQRLIKSTTFISFVLMIGMASVAKPMVLVLIGEKWLPSVPYLQLLCFSGMLYPLQALNLDMLQVKGRSDLFLKMVMIRKLLAAPTIIIGVFFGINVMLIGMIGNALVAYYLNSYWSGAMVGYPMKEQIADIMPAFMIAMAMGAVVFAVGYLLPLKPIMVLFVQLVVGSSFVFGISRFLRLEAYMEMRQIAWDGLSRWRPNLVVQEG
jgi:teichuronic acid exporter